MKLRSPIFDALAAVYEESQAGRTGRGQRDVQPAFEELCERASLHEGDAYELATAELKSIDGKLVKLEWDHPRARTSIHKVRLSPANEAAFYQMLGRESPTQRRLRWSRLFHDATAWSVPEEFRANWESFCAARAERAVHWERMEPLRLRSIREGEHLLEITRRLLEWRPPPHGNLIRWVSSHLCGNSKTLERAKRWREMLLHEVTAGLISDFPGHGILSMPREARVSGPLRLRIRGREFDCAAQEIATLSLADLQQAELVDCVARRCLTVENKTVFQDLAAKRSGELIVWTSFPNAATLALLALLPRTIDFWHFGDTDPSGFHILHDLCRRTGLPFRPFRMQVVPAPDGRPLTAPECALLRALLESPHMAESREDLRKLLERGRIGVFEQEAHQPAALDIWPFFRA